MAIPTSTAARLSAAMVALASPYVDVKMGKISERLNRLRRPKDPMYKAGRNDPCPCGSGLKFKKCCIDKVVLKGE